MFSTAPIDNVTATIFLSLNQYPFPGDNNLFTRIQSAKPQSIKEIKRAWMDL